MILAMYYKPHPDTAYESIRHITDDLWAGWLVRGMHRWGASVFIILMFLHMGRVFLYGAYKFPRELNWIIGALILVMGMMEGFFGYLLPVGPDGVLGDRSSASTCRRRGRSSARSSVPFLQGGAEIGPDTLARFYSLHMLVLPGAIAGLIGLHLYLVVRLGVVSPPWSPEAAGNERPGRLRLRRARGSSRPRREETRRR